MTGLGPVVLRNWKSQKSEATRLGQRLERHRVISLIGHRIVFRWPYVQVEIVPWVGAAIETDAGPGNCFVVAHLFFCVWYLFDPSLES